MVGLLALAVGGGLLFGMYLSMWSLYLDGLGASDTVIGLSFTLFAVPFVLVAPASGKLADRWDPRVMAVGSTLGLGLIALVFPLLGLALLAVLLGVVEGIVAAAGEPATHKLAADTAEPGREGRVFGVLGTAESAATTGGSAIGAALFALGVAVPFVAGAAACAVGAAVAAWCLRDVRPVSDRPAAGPGRDVATTTSA